jgi:hypothetical protein
MNTKTLPRNRADQARHEQRQVLRWAGGVLFVGLAGAGLLHGVVVLSGVGWENVISVVFSLCLLGACVAVYFAPSLCAQDHPERRAIFVLNLLLGWTFVGWVISLVWAVRQPKS